MSSLEVPKPAPNHDFMGRPLLFNDKLKDRILKLAEEGKKNEQIAYYIGISEKTFYNWLGRFPDLKTALYESKAVADELVEAGIFSRAIGYTHKEVKVFYDKDLGQVIEHVVDKHYPPDTSAGIFWLSNRNPEKWADKKEIKHAGSVVLEKLSDEEINKKAKELALKLLSDGGDDVESR